MKYLKLSYIQDQKIEKIILAELFWKTFLKCLVNLGSIKSVVALKSKDKTYLNYLNVNENVIAIKNSLLRYSVIC